MKIIPKDIYTRAVYDGQCFILFLSELAVVALLTIGVMCR
jgi:hypothetical protein